MKTSGFQNASTNPILTADKAVSLAKVEVTVSYDTVSVSFDNDAEMWSVNFFRKGYLGGDQTVYLNGNGITQLIVYGE